MKGFVAFSNVHRNGILERVASFLKKLLEKEWYIPVNAAGPLIIDRRDSIRCFECYPCMFGVGVRVYLDPSNPLANVRECR